MSHHEAPTTLLEDDPEHTELPVGEDDPIDATTEVIPPAGELTEDPATAEIPAAELVEPDNYKKEIPAHIRHHVGRVVLANRGGHVPHGGTKRENWLRPEAPYWGWPYFKALSPGHPHQHKINEVGPKVTQAVEGRQRGFDYGDHDASVNAAQGAIRSLAIKLHVNEFGPRSTVAHQGAVDHTGHRRTGYGTVQYRRPWSRLATHAQLIRTPEKQVTAESKLALREIGKMHNLDFHMDAAAAADEGGHLERALETGDPIVVRHTLGRLSEAGVISERNPLHARWAEVMNPRNVQKFKQWLIENSSQEETGESPETMILHISAAGIMGSVRPRAVADYLGVNIEDWNKQRYGFKSGYNELFTVPKEVVDQVSYLMKLDSRLVGGEVPNDKGGSRPKTALDVLIEYDAAQPMTADLRKEFEHPTTGKTSKENLDPMTRVSSKEAVAARTIAEQADRERAEQELRNQLAGFDVEEFGRRFAELSADDDADKEELAEMSKRRAIAVRKFKQLGVPIPAALAGEPATTKKS